jgi:hypothetical protein
MAMSRGLAVAGALDHLDLSLHASEEYAALAARIAGGLAHRSRAVLVPTTSPD